MVKARERRWLLKLAQAHRNGDLKCQVPHCRAVIKGMTGLQQLDLLRMHYKRSHLARLTLDQAMELRVRIEQIQGEASARVARDGF